MKLLIISCGGYPSAENHYVGGFIHTRVKKYVEAGHQCVVFVPSEDSRGSYKHEGVKVKYGDYDVLLRFAEIFKPDNVLVHFVDPIAHRFIRETNCPVVVWIHGYGAIAWYRYLYDLKFDKKSLRFLYVNIKNLIRFHFLTRLNIRFVFVSKWMHGVASLDALSSFKNYAVIPNPIDEKLFAYRKKPVEDRKNILLIRPFSSKKYANDVAIEAILELSKKEYFSELNFTICGEGKYFYLTDALKKFSNVKIVNRFLSQKEMSEMYQEHGIFLCPTRMDAQGVSMCEAMMSGLVPITSDNTAIPEFVEDGVSGYLTRSPREIAEKIELLYYRPAKFLVMSEAAHLSIQEKAGSRKIIQEELRFTADKPTVSGNLRPIQRKTTEAAHFITSL